MRTGKVKLPNDGVKLDWYVASILTETAVSEPVLVQINVIASDTAEAMLLANKIIEPGELLVVVKYRGSYADYLAEVWPNGEG